MEQKTWMRMCVRVLGVWDRRWKEGKRVREKSSKTPCVCDNHKEEKPSLFTLSGVTDLLKFIKLNK